MQLEDVNFRVRVPKLKRLFEQSPYRLMQEKAQPLHEAGLVNQTIRLLCLVEPGSPQTVHVANLHVTYPRGPLTSTSKMLVRSVSAEDEHSRHIPGIVRIIERARAKI